jgi:hypothetical protein
MTYNAASSEEAVSILLSEITSHSSESRQRRSDHVLSLLEHGRPHNLSRTQECLEALKGTGVSQPCSKCPLPLWIRQRKTARGPLWRVGRAEPPIAEISNVIGKERFTTGFTRWIKKGDWRTAPSHSAWKGTTQAYVYVCIVPMSLLSSLSPLKLSNTCKRGTIRPLPK